MNDKNEVFSDNLNSMLSIKRDYESKEFNYKWIDIFEDVLPYLDNIFRNPKRFIINDEEIVKVEKAKKITVESVIHLTQHTNFIQSIDEKTGDVRPSKILNINKDESLDTYENRFIYTLLKNMTLFYDEHSKAMLGDSYYKDFKLAKYEGTTKIGNEDINISLTYSSQDKNSKATKNDLGQSVSERLKQIKMQMDGFRGTELVQNLDRLHASLVRSPIRKTNVILKNPNFQKAEELWNFIQSYVQDDIKTEKTKESYMDSGEIKNSFDEAFILNYLAMSGLSKNENAVSNKKAVSLAIGKVIENILDTDDKILEEKLKKVFDKEYSKAKTRVDNRTDKMVKIFKNTFIKENNKIEAAIELLKAG